MYNFASLQSIIIVRNPSRPATVDYVENLKHLLFTGVPNAPNITFSETVDPNTYKHNLTTLKEKYPLDADLAITFGGDGSVLQTLHRLVKPSPVLGINTGNVGFLTACPSTSSINDLKELLIDPHIEKRVPIKVNVCQLDAKTKKRTVIHTALAFNELQIDRLSRQMLHLGACAGDTLLTNYEADGLIISSPTGSTAYNLSAGGPVVSPESKVLTLTAICPHTISNRSLVFDGSQTLRFYLQREDERASINVDNMPICKLLPNQWVEAKYNSVKQPLLFAKNSNFYTRLRDYLGWNRNDIVHPPFELHSETNEPSVLTDPQNNVAPAPELKPTEVPTKVSPS